MLNAIPEKTMHAVRWVLAIGWLLLIASLFYDPISPMLTDPGQLSSPFRAKPELEACVYVQGKCLPQDTYGLGAPVFWGMIVPAAILILLLFGHELWRRICPLSFLSQIPRSLGIQRKLKRTSKTGSVRFEIARIKPNSWLGKNYPYVQLGWFFVGISTRILFVNADRLALAIWLLATISTAILIGYLYGGKTWCNYFCPMAPVQSIYGEPGGLLTSAAHLSDSKITQSMCREIDDSGKEKSACVACNSPCIDIDSERKYWDAVDRPQRKLLYYCYAGFVVGYFCYYYLYSGNWNYYLSGVWAFETGTLAKIFAPGFYIAGHTIPFIPKLVAAPLTIALTGFAFHWLGTRIEKWAKAKFRGQPPEVVQHRIYTLITFFIFNFFYIFAGRNFIFLLPIGMQYIWDVFLVTVSTMWLYRTWSRNPNLYSRESLASRLRKQLSKLKLDFAKFLDGRSLQDLNVDEVYVLAKVLPGFDSKKRHEVYKGVLKESLEEGYVDTASSAEVLAQMRAELNISEDEHRKVLQELGVEDPELLDPQRHRTLEGSVRLNGYRKALERLLTLQKQQSVDELLQESPEAIRNLRQEYCISYQEEEEILHGFDEDHTDAWPRAKHILGQLEELIERQDALKRPFSYQQRHVLFFLLRSIVQKQQLLIRGLLETIEAAPEAEVAENIANELGALGPVTLQDVLENPVSQWQRRLNDRAFSLLQSSLKMAGPVCSLGNPGNTAIDDPGSISLSHADDTVTDLQPAKEKEKLPITMHLQILMQDRNPAIRVASLFILQEIAPHAAQARLDEVAQSTQELPTIEKEVFDVLSKGLTSDLSKVPLLEKLVLMADTSFFQNVHSDTMVELAAMADFQVYQENEAISDHADTCRELHILASGSVEVHQPGENGEMVIASLLPGELLDELEVQSHTERPGQIVATSPDTRILTIPVDAFDEVVHRDRAFADWVLEWESSRLQQLMKA